MLRSPLGRRRMNGLSHAGPLRTYAKFVPPSKTVTRPVSSAATKNASPCWTGVNGHPAPPGSSARASGDRGDWELGCLYHRSPTSRNGLSHGVCVSAATHSVSDFDGTSLSFFRSIPPPVFQNLSPTPGAGGGDRCSTVRGSGSQLLSLCQGPEPPGDWGRPSRSGGPGGRSGPERCSPAYVVGDAATYVTLRDFPGPGLTLGSAPPSRPGTPS